MNKTSRKSLLSDPSLPAVPKILYGTPSFFPPIQNGMEKEAVKQTLGEKVFGGEDAKVCEEAPMPTRRHPGRAKLIAKATHPVSTLTRATNVILNSEDVMEEDEEDDNCEILPLEAPQGFSLRFSYLPSDYIEYSIAIKSATDLCSTFDYFNAHAETYNLQVGYNIQQVCCLIGTATTQVDGEIVTVNLSFNPENSRFAVTIHSYNKDAAREVARLFRKLCRKGNFYKGKHLQANSLEREPLTFLANPLPQLIYGFEKEYASIRTNTLGFFKMTDIHRLCAQRGIMLYGMPGSGKSLIVSQIKRESLEAGITVIDMSMPAMHQIGAWYEKIEKWLAPCLIVMEDLDIIGASRDMEKAVQPITTDLLNSLSGNKKHRSVIVTLATTNRIDVLDSALTRSRRMDQRYAINGLNPSFKKQLFRSYFEPFKVEFNDEALDDACRKLGEDATGADVSSIAVSTMIHIKDGKSQSEAFELSLDEWEKAHKARGMTGFLSNEK